MDCPGLRVMVVAIVRVVVREMTGVMLCVLKNTNNFEWMIEEIIYVSRLLIGYFKDDRRGESSIRKSHGFTVVVMSILRRWRETVRRNNAESCDLKSSLRAIARNVLKTYSCSCLGDCVSSEIVKVVRTYM